MGIRHSTALLVGAIAIAGCGRETEWAQPLPADPQGPLSVQHTSVPVDMNALDLRLYVNGEARSTTDDWWGCSMSVGRDAAGVVTGTFLLANSLQNRTLFGTVTGGSFSRNTGGGGTVQLTGTLTTGASISLTLVDANSASVRDTVTFQTGTTSFTGQVRHGGVRLMRTLPLSHGTTNHPGFRFDPRIGLFCVQTDLDGELAPPSEVLPPRVLEVVRPDPVIDFKSDQEGGTTSPPGSDDNVPPS